MRPFGFNIVGPISANAGVGVAARDAIRRILAKGYQVATIDIDPGRGRGGHDTIWRALPAASVDDPPYGVTLAILSITALPDIIIERRLPMRDDTVNAGYIWWELPVLADIWCRSLEQFDVLIAGSQFLRSAFERNVAGTPTIYAMHGLHDIDYVRADRRKFGIPRERIVFICIVDPTSDIVRKNPYAAIDAFRRAFAADELAHLVIKINNAQAVRPRSRELASLYESVRGIDAQVTIIDSVLPHGEVMELFASCDVFIGLHRAEGLGLGLMEAMALGKPVVATGWSGNMSFMDHTNACLVGYHLIPASGTLTAYSHDFLKKDVLWADPDVDEAAAWMRALAADHALRETIGLRAAESMQRYRMEAERGTFIDELHAVWRHKAMLPPRRHGISRDEALAALRQARFDQNATPMQKVRRRSYGLLDRHLLWRFRSR
jgi:glycosyltransferase involved in cell wall biosynthesis